MVNATQDRSSGISTDPARSPYSVKASSWVPVSRLSKTDPAPAAGTPLRVNGLKVSKVPMADSRTLPPLGAFGFT